MSSSINSATASYLQNANITIDGGGDIIIPNNTSEVGIGTSSPRGILDVVGSGDVYLDTVGVIHLGDVSNNNNGTIFTIDDSGATITANGTMVVNNGSFTANGTMVVNNITELFGNVGIGSYPRAMGLSVTYGTAGGMAYPYEVVAAERAGDTKFGIYSSGASGGSGGASLVLGNTFNQDTNGNYHGFETQFVGPGDTTDPYLTYNALIRGTDGTVSGYNAGILQVNESGKVSIGGGGSLNTLLTPTPQLIVSGPITGSSLLVNGNITTVGQIIATSITSSLYGTATTASYVSASHIAGGLTKTQYVTSGSTWITMSFVNGLLTAVHP